MAKQTLEINLQDPNDVVASSDTGISANIEINGDDNENKTQYSDNDVLKLRYYSTSEADYSFGATFGEVSKIGSNIQFEQVDYVIFEDEINGSLTYHPIAGTVVSEWIGVNLGAVQFDGSNLKLKAKGYGVLKVTYQAKYDLLQIRIPPIKVATKVLVWVKQAEESTTKEIDYELNPGRSTTPDQTDQKTAPFELLVLDYTTETPIQDVAVSLSGMVKGRTGVDGKIFLGNLRVGNYALRLQKSNYNTSSSDGLNNDRFDVSAGDLVQ